ncbi:Domain of unknown function DUF4007 [Acidimicrobiia bacterium]
MKLEEACEQVFARHETFHPRFGWIGKAYRGGIQDEIETGFFNGDEAVVRLGVGRNMVKSIRYWGQAYKILKTQKIEGSRLTRSIPSPIGDAMLGGSAASGQVGFDPYCELPGSLWLYHWWLLAPKSDAPVWWLTFMEFSGVEFTAEELELFVEDRLSQFGKPPVTAIKKDVSCLLRMYLAENRQQSIRSTFDDVIDSPFRELGLIQPSVSQPGALRFQIGAKPSLPPLVLAFACVDYLERVVPGSRAVSIASLMHTPGAPGRAFKLTESAIEEGLREASEQSELIRLVNQSGSNQLYLEAPAVEVGDLLLDLHYSSLGWIGEVNTNSPVTGWPGVIYQQSELVEANEGVA